MNTFMELMNALHLLRKLYYENNNYFTIESIFQ